MTTTSGTTLRAVPEPVAEPTMSTRALDAITVVEAATMFGLPMPFSVSISVHQVDAAVWTYDELVTWAERLDVDVEPGGTGPDGRVHYKATGTIAGAEVTVNVMADAGADQ